MLSVLFWNLMGRRRESLVANLVRRHHVDVLVLAECQNPAAAVRKVNRTVGGAFFRWHQPNNHSRVTVFSRFAPSEFAEVESSQRVVMFALTPPEGDELLLVGVHATSALLASEVEQDEELRALAKRIAEIETARGHTRTLLVGDLNADPFDRRVQAATGLHAEKTRRIAGQRSRRVKGVVYRFFYNPMWLLQGRPPPAAGGTYYRRKAEHATRFWSVFDQALLRPALLPYFADADVAILTGDGATSFQNADGTPDKKVASDHFPILIHLSYPGV